MITGKLLYVSQHQSGFIWLHCDTNPQSENVVSSASLSHRLCQRILLRWNSPMVTPSLEVPGAPGLCACNFPWNFDEFAMETCFLEWKLVFYDVLFPSSFHRLSLIHWLIDCHIDVHFCQCFPQPHSAKIWNPTAPLQMGRVHPGSKIIGSPKWMVAYGENRRIRAPF